MIFLLAFFTISFNLIPLNLFSLFLIFKLTSYLLFVFNISELTYIVVYLLWFDIIFLCIFAGFNVFHFFVLYSVFIWVFVLIYFYLFNNFYGILFITLWNKLIFIPFFLQFLSINIYCSIFIIFFSFLHLTKIMNLNFMFFLSYCLYFVVFFLIRIQYFSLLLVLVYVISVYCFILLNNIWFIFSFLSFPGTTLSFLVILCIILTIPQVNFLPLSLFMLLYLYFSLKSYSFIFT